MKVVGIILLILIVARLLLWLLDKLGNKSGICGVPSDEHISRLKNSG